MTWKKNIVAFGAISIALLMVLSGTAVSQTHGAVVTKKLKQVEQVKPLETGSLSRRISDQKSYNKLISKVNELMDSETFKKYTTKIRAALKQKYGESFVKKIENKIKSALDKILDVLDIPSWLEDLIYEICISGGIMIGNIIGLLFGIFIGIFDMIPCDLVAMVGFGVFVGTAFGGALGLSTAIWIVNFLNTIF